MKNLPRYIVEKTGDKWEIWDTVNNEFTGLKFLTKAEASTKAQDLNSK